MPASFSPLALIVPRPQIPATNNRSSTPSSTPRTPNRSPVASHILLSPPSANRNSTDSWNSSNYDLDDPAVEWKEEQVRLLARTLDALPSHLITPFNGSVPPSNLLDKIARGISAAKGPNDWPHSVRITRVKLLELARLKAQQERRKVIDEEEELNLLGEVSHKDGTQRERTPDPAEVLQPRTNTPIRTRRPLYRQSSMDFMTPEQADRSESISRLSSRFQRHDRVLHHPYMRPTHARHRSEYNKCSPSTPSSSTLNSNRYSEVRKSTVSATSASTSSFGSPMSTSAPLRPSSLRRASTLTLASTSDMHVNTEPEPDDASKTAKFRRSGGYAEVGMGTTVAVKVKRAPSYKGNGSTPPIPATPSSEPQKIKPAPTPVTTTKRTPVPNPSIKEVKSTPRTPPVEPRTLTEKTTPSQTASHKKKPRKGHKPQLSLSSDEEEKIRSHNTKKARTHESSWPASLAHAAPVQSSLLLSLAAPREKEGSESGRSSSTGCRSKTSMSSTSSMDNDLSTASTDTAATTVSACSTTASQAKSRVPRNPNLRIQVPVLTKSPAATKKPARRNLVRNPSMFGLELPSPQRTPPSPARIPVSAPMPLSPPVNSTSIPIHTLAESPALLRPRTLRRAARRISFGNHTANGNLSPSESPQHRDGEMLTLGSAFQLS